MTIQFLSCIMYLTSQGGGKNKRKRLKEKEVRRILHLKRNRRKLQSKKEHLKELYSKGGGHTRKRKVKDRGYLANN